MEQTIESGACWQRLCACMEELPRELWGVCAFSDILPLLPCRAADRLPERPRSILTCLFPYYRGKYSGSNLAKYAALDDYHRVVGGLLERLAVRLAGVFPGESFVPFVDNSPVREVRAAALAGLGKVGRNGMLIHPSYGSYLFIGCLVTGMDLPATGPLQGGCQGCGICLAACPTGALGEGRALDRARCRSHITQKKGELTGWEREQIRLGGKAWGCDICNDCCPMNRDVPLSPVPGFDREIDPLLTRENLDRLLDRKPYGYRGKGVLLRNLEIITGPY